MPFDFDDPEQVSLIKHRLSQMPVVSGVDLQQLETLLMVSAICLTVRPGDKFTLKELMQELQEVNGAPVDQSEEEVKICLSRSRWIRMDNAEQYFIGDI